MNGISSTQAPGGGMGGTWTEGNALEGGTFVTGPPGTTVDPSAGSMDMAAAQEIAQIASAPGNSALKMNLAQQGVSLTDNSDVGAGKRFETFSEKLDFIREAKTKLLIAIMMSMVSSGGSGPSGSEEINDARGALKSLKAEASETKAQG